MFDDDADASGVMDPGERGLVGHKVFIDRNGDGVCNKTELWTRTSSTGSYQFNLLPAGVYTVRVVGVGGQRASTPESFRVRVPAEGRVSRYLGRTGKVLISGTVYLDANRNGTMDAGESGLEGLTIFDDRIVNGVVDLIDTFAEPIAQTDAHGRFEFTTLDAGTYTLGVPNRDLLTNHYEVTSPAGGYHAFTLSRGVSIGGINFGLAEIT